MPEPIHLSVSDIRRAIYQASDFAGGAGQPSTEALGSLFHRVFRSLMDPATECGWAQLLDHDSLHDHERLQAAAYESIIGPWIRANRDELHSATQELLSMWAATGHLCRHLSRMLINSHQQRLLTYDTRGQEWRGAERFSVEEPLSWLVEDPTWTAPVLVSGVADAVWRHPASKKLHILELKLGRGASEADMAQLCLYHEMLRSRGEPDSGCLSIWHFQPELKHQQVSAEELGPVLARLRALIGRLAGVVPLGDGASQGQSEVHRRMGEQLVAVLQQFGPMVKLDSDPVVGPAFLRFHIMPNPGVKVRKILPLGEDLALQLRLSKPALIRLEDGTLVVDLQRPDRETLLFREFRPLLPKGPRGNARMLVGVDLRRQPRYADLALECPHILAAGTTGSGKSEWLRMAAASLIATNSPHELRLMLIDPKCVTFGEMRKSPFLLDGGELTPGAFLSTPEEAIGGLHRLLEVMEERYQLFAERQVPDLEALKKQDAAAPPRIVCFCDEYGNLVAHKRHREAIELAINQLGAKARAAGIHLILATQDPRAQILSPALKSNLSGRVCLRTTSSTQSRMMLEQNGAESLLGYGDLFFKNTGELVRLQAPLLEDSERSELFVSRAGSRASSGA